MRRATTRAKGLAHVTSRLSGRTVPPPDSIASILQVTDTDPDVVEYLARTLLLESEYLAEGGEHARSQLRRDQAQAIAQGYGLLLTNEQITEAEFEEFFARTENRAS